MKKVYTVITVLLFGVVAIAQNNGRTIVPHLSTARLAHSQALTIKHRTTPTTQAVGDTVFVFDGRYVYDWNTTLPATFDIKLQDLDGYTVQAGYQPYFGDTISFLTFYDTIPNNNLCYSHPDTVFFQLTTSWFTPAGQANDWLELGPIHVPSDGGTLRWRHNFTDPGFRDGYKILVNTTGLASTNFTNPPIFTVADNDPATVADTVQIPHPIFYQRSADVSSYAGQDIYIAVNHDANDMNLLQMTDYQLIEGSSSNVNENNPAIASLKNMPNPASINTMITYSLKQSANVKLSVCDITGKEVSSFAQGIQSAGNHNFKLDVSNLNSGMYFYTISAGDYKMTSKMSVVK